MSARIAAFVIWGMVAASAVFWGLRLMVRPQAAPTYAVAAGDGGSARADLTRLLGAAPVVPVNAPAPTLSPELASRFKLLGVMASKASGPGFALIAVDGKLPRAFKVGAALDGNLVLQSVSLRAASIGPAQGETAARLELPPLPAPATGTLPLPVADGMPVAAPPPAVRNMLPRPLAQPVPPAPQAPPPTMGPQRVPGARAQ
jgi:general secretion pathway protein C